MTILAVLGGGVMGSYTAAKLAPFVDEVRIYDSRKLGTKFEFPNIRVVGSIQEAVINADFVNACVPTEVVGDVLAEALPYCKNGAFIGGQTSRKDPEVQAFREFARANPEANLHYLSIHTMCNPEKADPSKQRLGIIRDGPEDEAYHNGKAFYLQLPGRESDFESPDEHDLRVANTQVNTSRTMLTIASSFEDAKCFPWLNGNYGSGLDAMKFSLAMRAASFEPHVYKGIQFGNPVGKEIVTHSMEVESDLFRQILGRQFRQYRDRVKDAKRKIFGDSPKSLLSTSAVTSFSRGAALPNSQFSLINYVVAEAEAGRDLFGDIKATTAMHTGLISLVDFLFTHPELLDQSIETPFTNAGVRMDDLVFHNQFQSWSTAIVHESGELYDHMHAKMRTGLNNDEVKREVELSQRIVDICQDALEQRLAA